MADEIRRRIRWENKERQRKKREEKTKQREEEHNQKQLLRAAKNSDKKDQEPPVKTNNYEWLNANNDLRVAKGKSPSLVVGSPDASIASSVTFSQSPACKKMKAWEIVEPESPVARKRKPTTAKRSNLPPRPAPARTATILDDSDNDDDLLRDAMLLAQRRKDGDQKPEPKPIVHKAAPKTQNVAAKKPKVSYDSDDDDLLRDAMILEQKRKAEWKRPRADSKQSLESPSEDEENESSLGRGNRENMESQQSLASIPEEDDEKKELGPRKPRKKPADDESLWTDSESEQPKEEEKSGNKRKRVQPQSSSGKDAASKVARSSRSRPGGRAKPKSPSSDEAEEDDDDDIQTDQLKPYFADPKLGPPSGLVPLTLKHSMGERIVPAAINRYLKGYQREGVVFMHNRVTEDQGAILGDDMGLGKTVQVISLLAALLKKKGSGEDKLQLKRRQKIINQKLDNDRREQERALRNGTMAELSSHIEGLKMPKWLPILVIVPPSVIANWINEFEAWGHFGVVAFAGPSRDRALERISTGLDEIMVCGKSMFQNSDDLHRIKQMKWKLLIVDEYHQYKNFRIQLYKGLKSLQETCGAPLVGLTGTLMQNNHEELWSEVDLVNPGFLGTWKEFKEDTSVPIKFGRAKTADDDAVEEGNQVRDWLKIRLKSFYLQRRKIDVLKDDLPEKNERVVFCELSPLQKRMYQHMMTLPDFVLVKYANAPCECGVNQTIFQGFKQMRTDAEKVAYQRNHRDDIIPRKKCCHVRPLNIFRFDAGEEFYDPRAPLWRWQHETLVNGEEGETGGCLNCPYCISFAVLDKLYKISSHVSLLQLPKHPDDYVEGSRAWKDAQKALDFAKVAFPEDVLESLPGGSYIREDSIMDDHANLSGKMKMLADLLVEFNSRGDRLLIFSFSTQTLDLIQNFVKAQGYSFLRLDGSTPTKSRQGLVDKYQRDNSIFLFLISTKAGGLGLNLTAANVVIVFDVDFNPSNDEQSQDRAYRIGQKRDVLVIRLVSRGTIEELKYIRQLYKIQLKNFTIGPAQDEQSTGDSEAARLFRGVDGDKDRKGELFGMENLLKFKDGSFMDDLWKSARKSTGLKGLERFGLRSATEVADGIEGMSEEAVNDIGENVAAAAFREAASKAADGDGEQNGERSSVLDLLRGDNAKSHGDYMRADRGDALFKPGDEGFDEEMGGYSQGVHYVMENADVSEEQDDAAHNAAQSPVVSKHRSFEPSPVVSARPAVAALPSGAAAPSPVRSSPVRSAPVLPPPTRVLEHTTRDETPRREDLLAPTADQPAQEDNVARRAQARTPHEEKPKHVNSGGGKSSSTTTLGKKGASSFSSKDLFIPGKNKKKKKKSL